MTLSDYLLRTQLLALRQDPKFFNWNIKRLHAQNLHSKSAVTSPGGPVVSLTTVGDRINTVYLAIESIASGSVLPSRLILWIDNEEALKNRPDSIRRLEARGLEVGASQNYGPHTKYYPYLLATDKFVVPLVTADDDVVYAKWWLQGLIDANCNRDDLVNCYRAHVIMIEEGQFKSYQLWKSCHSTEASFLHFATGVSGCIYPIPLLRRLKAAGSAFQQLCPKADDIWLNVNALRGGFMVRQIRSWSIRFPLIPETQSSGLLHTNFHRSQNDEQIKNTYTADDLVELTEAGIREIARA
jgi:hypothetical protein